MMDVVQPHCSSEVMAGLKRERMGMRHHTHADIPGSCSKVGVNCMTLKKLGVCEPLYCPGETGQNKNL